MTDFASAQTQLAAALASQRSAQVTAQQAAARAAQAQAALDLATRQVTSAGDQNQQLSQLAAAAKQAATAQAAANQKLQGARSTVSRTTANFAQFSTPQQNVAQLSDSSPFLLLPVRIETRFRTTTQQVAGAVAAQHELLVRIYPDDCSIDTFEPMLSTSELANIKAYWMNIWRAGGIQNDQRGAWSRLVQAQGAGRAGWLADNYQPINIAGEPRRVTPTDEILVIPTDTPLSAVESQAISTYWEGVWLADDDSSQIRAANAALSAAVGAARAAQLVAGYVPFNLADSPSAPLTKQSVALSIAFVVFPLDPVTTQHSWTQAPQVRQFPDRFVVLGFSGSTQTLEAVGSPITLPLYTGPDPSADPNVDPTSCIHPDGADLFVPDQLQWMVDFDRAVAAGMALAIPLTADQYANGFTRLLVLGLQLSAASKDGPVALQELLAHHQWSRSGFFLLQQGTPAHNVTGSSAAATPEDDADASFNDRLNRPLFSTVSDPTQKRDGQWLAEYLGIDPAFVGGVHGSDGVDQMQARAMQTALWPATLGYWMDTLFTPNPGTTSIFSDAVIESTRSFFTSYVSGRGPLPAIRIAGQPYGILPVTAFSRIQWFQQDQRSSNSYLASLYKLLRQLDADWTTMSQSAAWVGKAGDPHQTLLDILGLTPSSIEYYSRNAESLSQLFNMFNRFALGPAWITALTNLNLQALAIALLQKLGYTGSELPDLLNHYFLTENPQITTIIDDRALSEATPVRSYTPDNRNYIQWLIDAATQSLDALRQESGFTNNQSPQALLYLWMRHALMLGYYSTSYNLHSSAGILSAPELLAMRAEPTFVHVAEAPGMTESRFGALYKTESRITGNATQLVTDYITAQLFVAPAAANLSAQIAALQILVTASTSQLERIFAEHIDICSYRYDAWLLGLVNEHIQGQLAAGETDQQPRGLYLGAYAWVEDLRPSADQLVPAQLTPDLTAQFPGTAPLMSEADNGGYIHAPSITHADAAAVLRAGFVAAKGDGNNSGQLAVNLSSDRVRVALSLIEGIRNGQSLGALLGYQFELGLHDSYTLAEVDKFIYPLRKQFPLVADALTSTQTGPDVPIEAIEARNVMDGKKLVGQILQSNVRTYPWGVSGLPAATPNEQTALNGTADALLNSYDAIADLALAEGVYQAVQGNYDRVASTIAAYTTGNFPPEPGIVDTSPPGVGLTHRFAIQFRPGLATPAGATPRAQAEPAIDDWLTNMLPPLDHIACTVMWTDPATAATQQHVITLADLGLRPIDTLYLLKPDNVQAMAEMDDRIQRYVFSTWSPRPDAAIQIQYMIASAGQFSVFESGPLLRNLRSLLTHSRPLRASDALRANDATQQDDASFSLDQSRITTPLTALTTLSGDIDNFLNITLAPLLADTTANRATIIAQVDPNIAQAVALLERAARLTLPSSGWGFLYAWLHQGFTDLFAQIKDLTTRWTQKLTEFNNALAAYDALPTATSDADRFAALQAAELIVSSSLDPLPATPTLMRAALPAKETALQNRLAQFQAIQSSTDSSFATLYSSTIALSTAEFDSQPFDVSSIGDRAITITQDISRTLTSKSTVAKTRITAVNADLTQAAAANSSADQVSALVAAAKALLGDDFQIIPEFTVSAAQGAEWANAINESTSGNLFTYLTTTLNVDFPVDEWFYAAARVREPLRYWESALMLAAAFGLTLPSLTPIQLPFSAGEPWRALQFPGPPAITSDRLLYTCIYSQPFDPGVNQCGIMVDEWTEVIPAATRDTGITFNYARPDNEPPQSMLLVVSASNTGSWQWADLVGALNETLDLAKKRAVEPAFLDPTMYSRFLPATVTASTTYGITIATPLIAANGVISRLQGGN
jgi:glucan-binding YG repeat protein